MTKTSNMLELNEEIEKKNLIIREQDDEILSLKREVHRLKDIIIAEADERYIQRQRQKPPEMPLKAQSQIIRLIKKAEKK